MVILGIDPGLAFTGYGIIESKGNRFKHIAHGAIETSKTDTQGKRLSIIYESIVSLIKTHKPEKAGIEALYFAKNVTSGLAVSQSLGVILLALEHCAVPVSEIAPNTVKKTVTGIALADKVQVQHCVKLILGLPDIPSITKA